MTENSTQKNRISTLLEIQYGRLFCELNERFFRRVDSFFSVINILGGSAVFIGLFKEMPTFSAIIGLLIAVMAYIEREMKPIERAIAFKQYKKKYGKLYARSDEVDTRSLDKELRILQSGGPVYIEGLSIPAHIKTLQSNGYPTKKIPISIWSRICSWIA